MSGMTVGKLVGSARSGVPGQSFPMEFFAPHERQAQRNHSQSLARLNERGGLSWGEAYRVLTDQAWEGWTGKKDTVASDREAVLGLYRLWVEGRALQLTDERQVRDYVADFIVERFGRQYAVEHGFDIVDAVLAALANVHWKFAPQAVDASPATPKPPLLDDADGTRTEEVNG